MSLQISPRAAERIHQIRQEKGKPLDSILRVGVDSGGCSGLTYTIDFEEGDLQEAGLQFFESQGIKMAVDMRSYLYLAGTELDYTDGLEGKGFHFQNPNASRVCSCGESFSV